MIENALSVIMGTCSLFAWLTYKKFVFEVRYAKIKEKISTIEIIVLGSLLFISIDQVFILLLLIYLYRAEIENHFSSLFCIDNVNRNLKKILVSLYCILLIWPFIYIVSLLSNFLITEAVEQKVVTILKTGNVKEQLYIIVSAIIVAPIIEELYFRHILYTKVKLHLGILPSIIICSIFFGIIHKNVYAYITLFTLSIFLCVIKEISGSTIFPIYVHSIFNIVMVIQIML
tara:strand:+ start:1822 stop:2511 length:690 start_codon:yes stop_codon:yes gene_type:complete